MLLQNAQISPQVSGYVFANQIITKGALVQRVKSSSRLTHPISAALDQSKGRWPRPNAQTANAELNVNRDIPKRKLTRFPREQPG